MSYLSVGRHDAEQRLANQRSCCSSNGRTAERGIARRRGRKTQTKHNPHELLFKNDSFDSFNPNPSPGICGTSIFNNNTRIQVREMTKQDC